GAYRLDDDAAGTASAQRLTTLDNLITGLNDALTGASPLDWNADPDRRFDAWLDNYFSSASAANNPSTATRADVRAWASGLFGGSSRVAAALPDPPAETTQAAWLAARDELQALRNDLSLTLAATSRVGGQTESALLTALRAVQGHADLASYSTSTDWQALFADNASGLTPQAVAGWATTLLGAGSTLAVALGKAAPPAATVSQNEWLLGMRELNELVIAMEARADLAAAHQAAASARASAASALSEAQAGRAALNSLAAAAAVSGDALATRLTELNTAYQAGSATLATAIGGGVTVASYSTPVSDVRDWLRRFDVSQDRLTAGSQAQVSVSVRSYGGTTPEATTTASTQAIDLTADALGVSRSTALPGTLAGVPAYVVVQQGLIAAELQPTSAFDFFDDADWTTWQAAKPGAQAGYAASAVVSAHDNTGTVRSDWVQALREWRELNATLQARAQLPANYAQAWALSSATGAQGTPSWQRASAGERALRELIDAARLSPADLAAKVTELKADAQISAFRGSADLFTWLREFDVPANLLVAPSQASLTLSTQTYTGALDATGTAWSATRSVSYGSNLLGFSSASGPVGAVAGLTDHELARRALQTAEANGSLNPFDGSDWQTWRTTLVGAAPGYTEAQVATLSAGGFTAASVSDTLGEIETLLGKLQDLAELQAGGGAESLVYATQQLALLGQPLSDVARRRELAESLQLIIDRIDLNAASSLTEAQKNAQLQAVFESLGRQWRHADLLSALTGGQLTLTGIGDLEDTDWELLRAAASELKLFADTLTAPGVLVVPDGVADITVRNLDVPEALATAGGLLSQDNERDAVQAALERLLAGLDEVRGAAEVEQNVHISALLETLSAELNVPDLLAELTEGEYSIDRFTGQLEGVRRYLGQLSTRAAGLVNFLTARESEADQRVTAMERFAGAYDITQLDNHELIRQRLSEISAALQVRVNGNVAASGINFLAEVLAEGTYAPGQAGVDGRLRDTVITPQQIQDWCVARFGASSKFKQALDLGNVTTMDATLVREAVQELRSVIWNADYQTQTPTVNDTREARLTAMATELGATANRYSFFANVAATGYYQDGHLWDGNYLRPAAERIHWDDLKLWAEQRFGPNSKIKAAMDLGNVFLTDTQWADAVAELSLLAADMRMTRLAANGTLIEELEAVQARLRARYDAQDWITHTSTPAYYYGVPGISNYTFTFNNRNLQSDWTADAITGKTYAISLATIEDLAQAVVGSNSRLKHGLSDNSANDNSTTYGDALKELNEIIVALKARAKLAPAAAQARKALNESTVALTQAQLGVTTLQALSTAAASGVSALATALGAAKASGSVLTYLDTNNNGDLSDPTDLELFSWLRGFDVDPSLLWNNSLQTALNWTENRYVAANATSSGGLPNGDYSGTYPSLTYLPPAGWAYGVNVVESNSLAVTANTGTWTPNFSSNGLWPGSAGWNAFTDSGTVDWIGVSSWRTRQESYFAAEASNTYAAFNWEQWKAGTAQRQNGSYLDTPYASAGTGYRDSV
ncbi:MAG: hypothetical protein RLZ83_1348, partial [Pseudomonadota bacterium]